MAYAFRNVTSQGNASGAGLTVTKPTGTVDGDLIVVLAYLEADTNTWSSVGAGFTSAGSFVNTGLFRLQVWWKLAASEPASWTWTPTTTAWRTVVVAAYSGATGVGTSRVDVTGAPNQGDAVSGSWTALGVTTTVAHDLLHAYFGNFQGTANPYISGPASNSRVDFGGATIGDALDQAAGATGATVYGQGTIDYAAEQIAYFLDTGSGATPARGTVTVPRYRRG